MYRKQVMHVLGKKRNVNELKTSIQAKFRGN